MQTETQAQTQTQTQPQPPSQDAKTPDQRATEFQAVQGGTETRSGTKLVVEAYAVLWVILMAWLLLVWRRQSDLNRRIDDLDRILDQAAAAKKTKKAP